MKNLLKIYTYKIFTCKMSLLRDEKEDAVDESGFVEILRGSFRHWSKSLVLIISKTLFERHISPIILCASKS